MLRNRLWVVALLILLIALCGCSGKASVEDIIQLDAENVVSLFEYNYSIHMNYSRGDNGTLIMYPDGHEDEPFELEVSPEFYEDNEFLVPKYVESFDFPKEQVMLFDKAKSIVVKYIKQSTVIDDSDKKKCIEAVKSAELRFGRFEEDYTDFLMVTKGNRVYLNGLLAEHNTVRYCVHELVHVISNVTNIGTRYEKSYYRSSLLNEALTDIIAEHIITEMTDEENSETEYVDGFEVAYHLIYRFDMLKTYYYSDGYDEIKEQTGSIKFNMLILLMDNNVNESTQAMISYIVNDL